MGPIRAQVPIGTVHSNSVDWFIEWIICGNASVKRSNNHLQLSSVIGSNYLSIPPPFLVLHLIGVRKSLVQAFSCHDDTLLILHTKMPSSFYRSGENLPKIRIWVLAKMWLHLDVLVPKRLSLFWRYEGKARSCSSKYGGKSLLNVADGQRTGSKHLTSLSGML